MGPRFPLQCARAFPLQSLTLSWYAPSPGWRALYTQGEVFRKEGDRLRRRMSPSLHSPPLGFFRAQLAGSRSANPAQTGALIRMFYLTRYVSLFVLFCCYGWHSYTLLSYELLEARRKTRTPCSNSLRRSCFRLQVRCPLRGRFAYLQFTEVLVFSMIWILFYDT